MGGSSSTSRVVTVDRDEGNVVTISEDVAKRLLGRQDLSVATQAVSEDLPRRKVTYRAQAESFDDETKMLEGHFRRRIKALESQNAALGLYNDKEFASAQREFEEMFQKRSIGAPVCCDLQQAVEQCYAANPGASLACIDHVKAFKDCVQMHRQAMFAIATKG